MYPRHFRRRPQAPNNAIDEGRQLTGLGELPEDLMRERALRPPILSPRGVPSADPFANSPFRPAQNRFKTVLTPWQFNGATVGSQQRIVTGNPNRAYLLIQNRGANSVFVGFNTAPAFNGADVVDGLEIFAGGSYELIGGDPKGGAFVPPEDIYMTIAVAGNQIGTVIEGYYFPTGS